MVRNIWPSACYLRRTFVLYLLASLAIGLGFTAAVALIYDPWHFLAGAASFIAGMACAFASRAGVFSRMRDQFLEMINHPLRTMIH
jgi:hypothetical protein